MGGARDNILMTTREGGRHYGEYLKLKSFSEAQLEKSIQSYKKQIAKHHDKISSPQNIMLQTGMSATRVTEKT